MSRLTVPAVAFGLLLFVAAAVVAVLFFAVTSGSRGAAWALAILLGVVVMLTAVAVIRKGNTGRADEP